MAVTVLLATVLAFTDFLLVLLVVLELDTESTEVPDQLIIINRDVKTDNTVSRIAFAFI